LAMEPHCPKVPAEMLTSADIRRVLPFLYPLSEGPRQAEDVLGYVREDEVSRDRSDLVETRLAELALYIVLGVEAVAAEGLNGGVGRLPRGVRGQELPQVRLGAARLPLSKREAAFSTISEAASTFA
jgi:hypothetical protein